MTRLSLLALAAALAIPATASANHGGMQDHGFYVGGFGVCWYGETRPDDYFGLNVHCPLQPMPGDLHNGG